MSTSALPTIPPRPVRAEQAAARGANKLPEIPPRPLHKRLDRSVSPGNYPRSPLNEPYNLSLGRSRSNDPSTQDPIPRRPSVKHLPSVGQEGMEYADIQYQLANPSSTLAADAAAETRSVGQDLHLHAPKPSLPKASATAQVQAVTRTDVQAVPTQGIGQPGTMGQDDLDPLTQTRSRASFSRPSSSISAERRSSIMYGEEQGPVGIGMRVPINPLLGDVQAPSPAPAGMSPNHTGQNGEFKKRNNHSRTKSGREVFPPPGSYGLHGHGLAPHDAFEKEWYSKHPEQLQFEEGHGHGVYESIGSGRGSFALSSDDLNKLVRNTASRGAGFGTSGNTVSYPDEQIGYMASEEYASRSQVNTPNSLARTVTNSSQPAVESPLRKSSFPANESVPAIIKTRSMSTKSEEAVEGGTDDPVHVDEPNRRYNKITGGEERIHETEEARPHASHPTEDSGVYDEHGYSVPILAADEVAKEVGSEHLHPAVSPKQDRRGSAYEMEYRSGDATPTSRPGSRPGSIYGMHSASTSLSRFISQHDDRESMHTPLEEVREYEPLFPDEDGNRVERILSHAERFKQRPEYGRHRFPSQDIWEDTPSSSMHQTTVSTPDLPAQVKDTEPEAESSKTFEPPEVEAARKGEPSEEEKQKLLPKDERLAKSKFAPHLRDDMPTRPGMVPRFPSQDIWEDSPDSSQLVTTVNSPPVPDEPDSPEEDQPKPHIPPRPANKSRLGEGASSSQIAPSIPSRSVKHIYAVPPADAKLTDPRALSKEEPATTEIRKVPSIPDRPKPQVPARPAKKTSLESLSKTVSATSTASAGSAVTEKADAVKSPPLAKAKPQIPARPAQSSKIANLRGNFMNDLNQKLGLGPPKDKESEPEPEVQKESKPLEDARKGRARGPQRRAPAKSPSAVPGSSAGQSGLSPPKSLWHIDNADGTLNVPTHKEFLSSADAPLTGETRRMITDSVENTSREDHAASIDGQSAATIDTTMPKTSDNVNKLHKSTPQTLASPLSTNTAGESTDPTATLGTPTVEKSNPMSQRPSQEDLKLSQKTTASSGAASGQTLTREEPDPNTDAIPISRQTTAETQGSGHTLEKIATEEPRQFRDEQVSAPAPAASPSMTSKPVTVPGGEVTSNPGTSAEDEAVGAAQAIEPSPEKDVSYKKLEELSAIADGKTKSSNDEGGSRKILD